MKLYDTIEKGQLRQWKFVSRENATIGGAMNVREGKCFLVVGVDGIRCDTIQDAGSNESFYAQWLITNSRPVR